MIQADKQDAPTAITMHDILALKSQSDFERDTRISLKNDYIYTMVSKAASSTVTYHLQFAELRNTPFSVRSVNSGIMSPHLLPYQLKPETVPELMASDAVRKVAFVRNPYTRLLSCYLHRIVGTPRANPSKRILRQASRRKDVRGMSFADFILCICDQPSLEMERHWCVQHEFDPLPAHALRFHRPARDPDRGSALGREAALPLGRPRAAGIRP